MRLLSQVMFSFESLLNSAPQIADYFNKNFKTPQDSFNLAQELLFEAIRNRIELQKTLLYPNPLPK